MRVSTLLLLGISLCFTISCVTNQGKKMFNHFKEYVDIIAFNKNSKKLSRDIKKVQDRIYELEINLVKVNRVDAIEEEITQIRRDNALLKKQIKKLESRSKSQTPVVATTKNKKPSTLLEQADQHFRKKEYQKAILKYDEFKKKNKNSKKESFVIFRIAKSFQSLGLSKESSLFFKELVDRFPRSKEAKQAQKILSKK